MENCKYIGDCENKCLTHCLEKNTNGKTYNYERTSENNR